MPDSRIDSAVIATKKEWNELRKNLRVAVRKLTKGEYTSGDAAVRTKISKRKGGIAETFETLCDLLSSRDNCVVSYSELNPCRTNKDSYQKACINSLAMLIRDVDSAYDLKHVSFLEREDRQQIEVQNSYAVIKSQALKLRAPNFALHEAGMEVRGNFDWRVFAEEIDKSNKVFILQNSLPNCKDLFPRILRRKRNSKGPFSFRCTVYDPRGEAAKKRSRQMDRIFGRHKDEVIDLITFTCSEYDRAFARYTPPRFELRYTSIVLPYVVYATDLAVWVGWLWRGKVTNDGLQFYGKSNTELHQIIWEYLESIWESDATYSRP